MFLQNYDTYVILRCSLSNIHIFFDKSRIFASYQESRKYTQSQKIKIFIRNVDFLEPNCFMLKIIFLYRPYNLKYIKCQNNSFSYKIMTHMLFLEVVWVIYRFFSTSNENLQAIKNLENISNLRKSRFSSEI